MCDCVVSEVAETIEDLSANGHCVSDGKKWIRWRCGVAVQKRRGSQSKMGEAVPPKSQAPLLEPGVDRGTGVPPPLREDKSDRKELSTESQLPQVTSLVVQCQSGA